MKLLLWNIEWAPSARIRDYVRETLRAESPDVFCLTESTDFFASEYANVITSTEDYGYANDGDRRKVWLVSRCEWTAIDHAKVRTCHLVASFPVSRKVSESSACACLGLMRTSQRETRIANVGKTTSLTSAHWARFSPDTRKMIFQFAFSGL